MKKATPDVVVKDDFRNVTFFNADLEMTLCTECLDKLKATSVDPTRVVSVAIIVQEYEECQCDQCSAVNAMTAYYDEIHLGVQVEADRRGRAVKFAERRAR